MIYAIFLHERPTDNRTDSQKNRMNEPPVEQFLRTWFIFGISTPPLYIPYGWTDACAGFIVVVVKYFVWHYVWYWHYNNTIKLTTYHARRQWLKAINYNPNIHLKNFGVDFKMITL